MFIFSSYMYAESCIQIFSNSGISKKQLENFKKVYGEIVFVAKRGKYDALRVGMFSNRLDANSYMTKNKTLFKNAIIIDGCTNESNLPLINKKENLLNTEDNISSSTINNEFNINTIFDIKKDDKELFDHYSYINYFQRLLKEDENLENSYYENEITKIEQLIREDDYNSNIYLSATSGISTDYTTGTKESNFDNNVRLNWQYRLYDGQKKYIYDQVRKISEQSAQVVYNDAKNNLALLGADLYGNLLSSQATLTFFKDLYDSQNELYKRIHENRIVGLSTVVDEIDSKDDLIEIEKQIIGYEVLHSRNTFILKQSINSKSTKPVYLMPLNITDTQYSDKEEEKILLNSNPAIVIAQNNLKDSKVSVLTENSRYLPSIDLSSSYGYSWTRDLITKQKDQGIGWETLVNFNMPIYERNDIYLNEQRTKVIALQRKNDLKLAIKETLNTWDNHKKTIQQLSKENKLLKTQLSGQKEKINIVKKQYLEGKIDYREYANSLNRLSTLTIDLINNIINSEKQKIIGNYLLGKKIYDAKN